NFVLGRAACVFQRVRANLAHGCWRPLGAPKPVDWISRQRLELDVSVCQRLGEPLDFAHGMEARVESDRCSGPQLLTKPVRQARFGNLEDLQLLRNLGTSLNGITAVDEQCTRAARNGRYAG